MGRVPIRPRPALGVFMVVVAALFFAVNGSVAKTILQTGIAAPDLTAFRALGAATGLFVLGAVIRPGLSRFRITRREIPLIVVMGLTGFYLVPMLYLITISRLPVGIGLLLQYLAPLLVALWARFGQGQAVRARLWVGFAFSLAGLAIVADVWGGDIHLDPVGVGAGLLCAVLFALYFVLSSRSVASRDPISLTGFAFTISAAAGFAVKAIGGGLPDWTVLGRQSASGIPIWLLCSYLVILGTIVPYLLIVASLRHLSATSVGVVAMTEPVLASAVAWVALGESLNAAQLAGGAILLAGVVLAETARVTVRQNEAHVPAEDLRAPERESSPATAG